MAHQWASFLGYAVLFFACHQASSMTSKFSNETDRQSLLSFKSTLSDDSRESMVSWNTSVHFCEWTGITCGKRHPQRVVSLVLASRGLFGSISPSIANLTFLKKLDLSHNQLRGHIPQEIGQLHRLQHLNLSFNPLEGGIPIMYSCSQLQNISMRDNMLTGEIQPSLSNCSHLRYINLSQNNLTGHIPPSLTNLSFLIALILVQNQLSGSIPTAVGHLSSLKYLLLSNNNLSGTIPPSTGKLFKLEKLELLDNHLSGSIPYALWNMSSLRVLLLNSNNLSGLLPANLGHLPLIDTIQLEENQFHGSIPLSLANASRLEIILLGSNRLSATIPPVFGRLQNLKRFGLNDNLFEATEVHGWSFLDDLTNCTNLRQLGLENNHLGGVLPYSIRNLSAKLEVLYVGQNGIHGSISPDVGNLVSLTFLSLGPNLLTGPIPATVGLLQNMHVLDLNHNKLSGGIPSTLGNVTPLIQLYLDYNQLSGTIPSSLENCQNLVLMSLKSNKLSGFIPKEIFTIFTLSIGLSLAMNSFTGPLPSEIGTLKNLEILDVRMNKLSGEIPSSIGECTELRTLLLGGNFFEGSIPSSFGGLRSIDELDLSQNNLSGRIPDFLQDFPFLNHLNLSFNNFEGDVPRRGVFANPSALSIIGNKNICGGNPKMHLSECSSQVLNKKHNSHQLAFVISIAGSSLFVLLLFCFLMVCCWIRKSRKKHIPSASNNGLERVSYVELARATNGFSEDNLIGSGCFAKVYKGILFDDDRRKVVAVKVLNLQLRGASKIFMAECEALRNIRHRNLVKVITVCSSIDSRGDEFKALVLEYMANGNLDDWLHPKENEQTIQKRLTLVQRLNIAIDVAMGLDYLHNNNELPIIHCDMKPSNVLLDEDMTAHLGDFGLSRILQNASHYSTSSIGLKGTIGYVPPEYGMAHRVSTRGDVYSYGILLLEMFTAKMPTGDVFVEGQSLRNLVEMALPQRVTYVIDPQLLSLGEDEETDNDQSMNAGRHIECIASVLQIGIMCSSESPTERLKMGEVTRELHKIRELFLKELVSG